MKNYTQLSLFGEQAEKPRRTRLGGSKNPIVFHDYDSFIAKFTENPKTTDECWTPKDVYEAVLQYVGEIHDLEGKEILRPFYPGGDYENAEYPGNGVVVDNPPFSIFTRICGFLTSKGIPFFLFGPGLTIGSICRYCTAVTVAEQITFTNGAKVRCGFATNLMGDTLVTTSVRLTELLARCPSQIPKNHLPSYSYPAEVLGISDFNTMAKGTEDFSISRKEAAVIRNLDLLPRKKLFGDHFLCSEAAARKAAARKAAYKIPVRLSERERKIVESLGGSDEAHDR